MSISVLTNKYVFSVRILLVLGLYPTTVGSIYTSLFVVFVKRVLESKVSPELSMDWVIAGARELALTEVNGRKNSMERNPIVNIFLIFTLLT